MINPPQRYIKVLHFMHDNEILKTKWLSTIKNILEECGLSYIWDQQDINTQWLALYVKQTLRNLHTKLEKHYR